MLLIDLTDPSLNLFVPGHRPDAGRAATGRPAAWLKERFNCARDQAHADVSWNCLSCSGPAKRPAVSGISRLPLHPLCHLWSACIHGARHFAGDFAARRFHPRHLFAGVGRLRSAWPGWTAALLLAVWAPAEKCSSNSLPRLAWGCGWSGSRCGGVQPIWPLSSKHTGIWG